MAPVQPPLSPVHACLSVIHIWYGKEQEEELPLHPSLGGVSWASQLLLTLQPLSASTCPTLIPEPGHADSLEGLSLPTL